MLRSSNIPGMCTDIFPAQQLNTLFQLLTLVAFSHSLTFKIPSEVLNNYIINTIQMKIFKEIATQKCGINKKPNICPKENPTL